MSLKQPLINPPSKHAKKVGRVDKFGNDIYTNKYTEEQKLFMITCIAEYMSPMEVGDAFKEKFGFEIYEPAKLLYNYRHTKKWKSTIEEIRRKYLADLSAVAGSHKRVRLDRADRIYKRAYARNEIQSDSVALASIDHQKREFEKYEDVMLDNLRDKYAYMSKDEVSELKVKALLKLKEISNGNGGIQGEVGKQGKD